ncbi:prepilin-type N-terminal cleavage/methylation domain-containing protein [Facklamia hominis]|uniref:Prepilin-type N-terminal cleavage/methylation domain-containing protein n=1 Tax=Facklamia hominis TaxID=178214 RepID=A0AAJ1Q583_9LACT|nr:prepilin-type N-terminal cleavage/methylation domain-containing protein [Facklamia hominis]MDK7187897.1 prepilin-type N-terminal cleavage/methylation domain-containing protein [Facklamia hominis]
MKLFWKTGNYPLKQAFTLLECLISLMIFSLVLHGLLTAVDYYKTSDQRMRQNRQNDLHHFELLFEEELKHYQVVQVHDQRLVLANPEKTFNAHKSFFITKKSIKLPATNLIFIRSMPGS